MEIMRFLSVLWIGLFVCVDGAPCQRESKCMNKALEMLGQLRDEISPSSETFDVLGTTCTSEELRLMSMEEIENHNKGDMRAMCKETYSNAKPECDIRVVCRRLSSGIVPDSGPFGLISNAFRKLDRNARSSRLEDAIDSCECEFLWKKARHDWAVLVHGGQCDWFGEMFGAPFHYGSPAGKIHKRKDTGMELAVLEMHKVLTERFHWDPSKIIVFSCSETLNAYRDRVSYTVQSDYSGPCNNANNLRSTDTTRSNTQVLHGGSGHCTSPNPMMSEHVMPCSDKDGGAVGMKPDKSFKPTVQCGCARCKEEKRILPGEKILLYIRGHGGRHVEEESKRQMTFVELYTNDDTNPFFELFLLADAMIHDLLIDNTIVTTLIDSCYSAGMVSGELLEVYNSAKEHLHVRTERNRRGKEDRTRVGADFVGHVDGKTSNQGQIAVTSAAEHCVAKRMGRWSNPFTESLLTSLGVVDRSGKVVTEHSDVGTLYDVMNRMQNDKFMPFVFGDATTLRNTPDVSRWFLESPNARNWKPVSLQEIVSEVSRGE